MPAPEQHCVSRQSLPFALHWPSCNNGRVIGAKVASGTAGTVGSISTDGHVGTEGNVATSGSTGMSPDGIGGKATISPAMLLGVKDGGGDVVGGNGGCPGMASSLKL